MQPTQEAPEPLPSYDVSEQGFFSGLRTQLPRRAATGVTVLLALATMAGVMAGMPIHELTMAEPVFTREPWRLLTSTLHHVGFLHLGFNVYWTWVLGGAVEARIGTLRTLGLITLLATVSSAAEYTITSGGVGLSGVVYGLFGCLWAWSGKDSTVWENLPENTFRIFVGWFFVCIALTYADIMPVANIAHGAGCVIGGLIGLGWLRLTLALSAGTLVLAGVARPYLNLGGERGAEYSHYTWLALEDGDHPRAARLGAESVKLDPDDGFSWLNYGVALENLGRNEEALAAYERAVELEPLTAEHVDIAAARVLLSSDQ